MSIIISSNRPGGGIKWQWPSVHPEGRKFLLISGIITLCLWLLPIWSLFGWLMLGVTIWVGAFFRDPVRITPASISQPNRLQMGSNHRQRVMMPEISRNLRPSG